MLTVSNYHYIRENFNSKYPSIFGLTPGQFKEQLLLLKNQGCFISSSQLIKNSQEILNSKDNFILITFDDGLKEQFDYGLSVLDELNIPALFFANSVNYSEKVISTVHKIHLLRSRINSERILEKIKKKFKERLKNLDVSKMKAIYIYDDEKSAEIKYILNFVLDHKEQEEVINEIFIKYFDEEEVLNELYMSIENLKELGDLKYLGSHTHSHYPLGLLNSQTIKSELKVSKDFFEMLTNSKIETVAYPYGTDEVCTEKVSKLAYNTGYKFGFTTKRGVNSGKQNNLLLNRFDCNDLIGGKNKNK
jgi:peptidoglycan/xylan/chitin deacetylase (PgdA/CDA1 family)